MIYYHLLESRCLSVSNNKEMNSLATMVDNFLYHGRYSKANIAKQLGITRQGFYNYLRKSNFNIDDANRILAVIGYKIDYDIKPL